MDEVMDGTIIEVHFKRLAGVPRTTRQVWERRGWVRAQHSPYNWPTLAEVVVLRELRAKLDAHAVATVWTQLKPRTDTSPDLIIVDQHTLEAAWVDEDDTIISFARSGHPVLLMDFSPAVREAQKSFALVVAAEG